MIAIPRSNFPEFFALLKILVVKPVARLWLPALTGIAFLAGP